MKLYKISQDENSNYDTYDSAIVAAPDEETARDMEPSGSGGSVDWTRAKKSYGDWARSRDKVMVEYIGEAKDGTPQGVICASFNAG